MRKIILKFFILISLSLSIGLGSHAWGLNLHQSLSLAIFFVSILGTLFFWEFRLSFAFLGTSLLLITRAIDIDNLIKFSSLEIILFLVGMMVLIGLLKEAGMFAWVMQVILRIPRLTSKKFLVAVTLISAFLACAIDEVTSILFVVAAVLEICDYFEVNPVPFVITAVLATNIGSAGTVLGNPIGILIAVKSGLGFEDFLIRAFPLVCFSLLILIAVLLFWYRKALAELDIKIKEFGDNPILRRLISVPMEKRLKVCLGIFIVTLIFIALHYRLELLLGLEKNTILLIVPLVSSGLVMIWKWKKARSYIEKDVEWWTLLFFLLLFAQAGTLNYTGTTDFLAEKFIGIFGKNTNVLTGFILWVSALGSSVLDNVVLVAAFIPVLESFKEIGFAVNPLWWALLFGGCFGGNITLVGSTANIVALGVLEKERKIRIGFLQWLGIGLTSSLIILIVVWVSLLWLPLYR
ncbi:MAG: SLC13 family permease [Candidatus Omnitrophota bacterium]